MRTNVGACVCECVVQSHGMYCLLRLRLSPFVCRFLLQRPFFEVDVQLAIPDVKLSPDPSDVQLAMNRCAVAVINCNKRLWDWGQEDVSVRF
jgi:hypothetical protein